MAESSLCCIPTAVILLHQVIADITKRMGAGMAQFVSKDLGQGMVSTAEYNQYCHFVAGLVGDGLTRLFAATGVEGPQVLLAPELANRCALTFCQIIFLCAERFRAELPSCVLR